MTMRTTFHLFLHCGYTTNGWAKLLRHCKASWKLDDVDEGLNLHCLVIRNCFLSDVSIRNSLLSMYANFGDMDSAQGIFDEATKRDVITWSSLIGGYAQSGEAIVALQLFKEMYNKWGIDMDGLTAVSVLQACCITEDILLGSLFHAHLICKGFEDDLFVGNSLIDMYSKCHNIDSAYIVFDMMTERNTVSWNSMMSGLVHNEKYWEAVALLDSMRKAGVQVDDVTLVKLLQSCKKLNQEMWCKCIHSVVIKKQARFNIVVFNNLLDAYGKCNNMELSMQLFRRMESRNVVSWSIIIAGFVHIGQPDKAISFFREMWLTGEQPNSITMLGVLEACAAVAELKLSKCAHGIIVRNELTNDLTIGTAVLNMYAKCGEVKAVGKVFDSLPQRNVISWNAMVGALGMNGCAQAALAAFREMESEHVKPDEVTFLATLSACSHGGLVEEGLSIFQRMTMDPSIQPSVEHYSCVVDMLGRAGDIKGALEVIKRMPEGFEAPAAWGSLLSACRSYGNYEVGQNAASRILELEPLNSASYLLASSMYAKGGSMDDMVQTRLLMKKRGVKVNSGYSLVHVGQKPHKFVSWDGSHPQSEDIYFMVELLHNFMFLDRENNDYQIT
ncbi:pentatricopeptide repeat-containing protein [Canna indica]|uniref:Pentatricopeptide repeat-containing protein n=1 Tax=Canna indica TaxID=4628 RepID=A0AAQ3KQX7_9LILI|nr:pentatricopeptide repeat-containing protein [Canna indica]